jgi:hypothetical protein
MCPSILAGLATPVIGVANDITNVIGLLGHLSDLQLYMYM